MGRKKTSAPVSGSTNKNLAVDEDENLIGTEETEPVSVPVECEEKEGHAESAAAKKKRKRKEKERAKKAAAEIEEKAEESKKSDKKVAKHVREMQERIARKKEAEERKNKEVEERKRREEEEDRRQKELERIAQEKKRLKKEKEKQKLLKKKQEGKPVTGKQKEAQRKLEAHRKQIELRFESSRKLQYSKNPQTKATENVETREPEMASAIAEVEKEEDEETWDTKRWDDVPSSDGMVGDSQTKPVSKNETPTVVAVESKKPEEKNLRSPICCIMGHVDAGKTKLLDCIRGTSVQEGEAGGITQQIGATYFPAENIREKTKELKADAKLNVPGLLVIDTPGHQAFNNLRSRGSGLCDIAILVVDIMHGLEPQTIESLNLFKSRNADFIIALNKVDRLYGWKANKNAPIRATLKKQSKDVKLRFNERVTQVKTAFMEQGINTTLYYENREMGETISMVPTSAISGEGIPDMLLLLVQWAQRMMIERLTFQNKVQCSVLEVKVVEGHGTTIDVVLVNGVLRNGDKIVVCGMQGPIVTNIRSLLTPHPMKELRVKATYLPHQDIKAAQGIKITAHGLEQAIPGTALYVVGPNDVLDEVKESVMEEMKSVMNRIDKSGQGVYVQASTLGSIEALMEFLKSPSVSIPVSGFGIGPVHKKDVMKASIMLEKKKEFGTILAFDVTVTSEARKLADEAGVKIFSADIIYHLFDQFKAYVDNLKEEKKEESSDEAVFPCVLKIDKSNIFRYKNPIILGVEVLHGVAKVGTPLCIPSKGFVDIGRIESIKKDDVSVNDAEKGQSVCIKIVGSNSDERKIMYGRHFRAEDDDELVSHISRSLKKVFRIL